VTGRRGRRAVVALVIAAVVLLFDQWTKALVQSDLGPGSGGGTASVIGDWFLIEYAQNRGVAFGALARLPDVAMVLPAAILAGVIVYAVRRRFLGGWLIAGAGLVVGGAVGNLLDRLRWGYVIDFVAIGPWPNFNIADAAISTGVLCLVLDSLRRPDEPELTRSTVDG
jgi:signal peptidase II